MVQSRPSALLTEMCNVHTSSHVYTCAFICLHLLTCSYLCIHLLTCAHTFCFVFALYCIETFCVVFALYCIATFSVVFALYCITEAALVWSGLSRAALEPEMRQIQEWCPVTKLYAQLYFTLQIHKQL